MKARNRHACAPILRKGGAHGPSQKAERTRDRVKLKSELRQIKATDGRLDAFWGWRIPAIFTVYRLAAWRFSSTLV